jgi:hypothetical protein
LAASPVIPDLEIELPEASLFTQDRTGKEPLACENRRGPYFNAFLPNPFPNNSNILHLDKEYPSITSIKQQK